MNWLQYKPDFFEYRGRWIFNWFSNFEPCNITIDGIVWPSVENYYQAMKSNDPVIRQDIRRATPAEAKKMGRRILIRSGWLESRNDVMMRALVAKFNQAQWQARLVETGTQPLIEWNNWGDRIWGVTTDGIGDNLLGRMLMDIRDDVYPLRDVTLHTEQRNPAKPRPLI